MWGKKFKNAILAGAAVAVSVPNVAAAEPISSSDAEHIRKLEIMLMVSSLRCRSGESSFQEEYRTFSTLHIGTLKTASKKLRSDLARQHGTKGATRALDRISVSMANRYGGGHPWMDCGELKGVTADLGRSVGRQHLVLTAGYLLAPHKNETFALASAQ